jgi:hypothetical protein
MSIFTQAAVVNVDGTEYRFGSEFAAIEMTMILSATPAPTLTQFTEAVANAVYMTDNDATMAKQLVANYPELLSK